MAERLNTGAAVEVLATSNCRSDPATISSSSDTWPNNTPSITGEKSTDKVIGAASVDMPFSSRNLVMPEPPAGSRLSSRIRLACGPSLLLQIMSV